VAPDRPRPGGRGPRAASTSRSARSMLPTGRGASIAATTGEACSEHLLVRDPEGSRQWRSLGRRGSPRHAAALQCAGDLQRRASIGREPSACFGCPGGAHGVSPPSSRIRWRRRRQRDPSLGEVSEEEVALEEVGEVLRVSRRPHLKGAAGIEASNPSAGIGASAQCSAM
jgi:hypothetical protein